MSDDEVRHIYDIANGTDLSINEIIEKAGVGTYGAVDLIMRGKAYTHVPRPGGFHRIPRKGIRKGSRSNSARLTADQVVEIRRRHKNGTKGVTLAKDFDVSTATISMIINRKMWTDL